MKEFKISCSSIGKIMPGNIGLTEIQEKKLLELQNKLSRTLKQDAELELLIGKKNNPELPQGAKSYCELWVKQQIYSRRKEFTSKYTDKGNIVEWRSLDEIGKFLGVTVEKNEEYFDSDFIHGFPDSIIEDYGIDAKTPWDCFSFPLFDTELKDDDYYWQSQGYMSLTGKSLWKIAYVLIDTPEHLIKNEARSWCFKNGAELSPEIMSEFREKMTYDNIPIEHKIKVFNVERNESDINSIIERVKMCRIYMNEFLFKTTLGK